MPAPKERMGGIFALGIMIRAEDETGERGELKRPLEFFSPVRRSPPVSALKIHFGQLVNRPFVDVRN